MTAIAHFLVSALLALSGASPLDALRATSPGCSEEDGPMQDYSSADPALPKCLVALCKQHLKKSGGSFMSHLPGPKNRQRSAMH